MAQVRLPNGTVISVPEDATREEIQQYSIARGFATEQDFAPMKPEVAQPVSAESEQPEFNMADRHIGTMENILSMGTGAVGEIAGGLAGLLSLPFKGAQAGDVVNQVSQALTYSPRTEAGKYAQQQIGEALTPIGEAITTKPGDFFFEAAKSPAFMAAAQTIPGAEIIANNPQAAGAFGASVIPATLELLGVKGARQIKTAKDARQLLAREIADGNRNIDNITQTLDAGGNLVKNPNAKRLASLIPDDVKGKQAAVLIENMNDTTKRQFNRMLDIVENQRNLGAEYAMDNRVNTIVGGEIANRIRDLERIRKKAGSQLDSALNKIGDSPVDVTDAGNNFFSKLQEAGVSFSRNENGALVSNFDNAMLNLGDVLSKQNFDKMINMLGEGQMTAKQAHEFKRYIREFVSYDKGMQPVGAPQSKIVSSAIKELSADVNSKISELSPEYAQANARYQTVADPLNNVQKQLKGMNIDDDIATAKLGDLAKRIGTNYTSRQQIIDMIDSIDAGLADNGIQYKGNIKQMVAALDMLDEVFQTSRSESPFGFKAGIESGTRMAAGDKMAAVQAIDNAIKKLKDKDFNDRMRILRAATKGNQ